MQGDRHRLEYKGRERSHRFTILGDSSFEYDLIFNREPESNVVTLHMEGAEKYNFFRQPDFVPDPFLKGSYAVYKKENIIGEGTGKLCHIHRPLIIDARGRRVWGNLAVIGNELRISIPEKWLGEAAYPVIVDPVVGTTTVGSQTKWVTIGSNGGEQWCLLGALAVNRFVFPESYEGNVSAYLYAYDKVSFGGCRPVLYSDNNNIPLNRLSSNEGNIDIEVSGTNYAGWRSSTFNINTKIQSGSYIWFGISATLLFPRFDYGEKLYWYSYDNYTVNLPNTFPLFPDGRFYDYKVSMYFNYTTSQNFIRTLTQGVTLTDSRKYTAEYKRRAEDMLVADTAINMIKGFFRNVIEAVQGHDNPSISSLYLRNLHENITLKEAVCTCGVFLRGLFDSVGSESVTRQCEVIYIKLVDTVVAVSHVFRGLFLVARIFSGIVIRDGILGRFLKSRQEIVLKSKVLKEIILDSKI